LKLKKQDAYAWYALAIAQLQLGDKSGFSETGRRMIEAYGADPSPEDANEIAWTLVLGECSKAVAERALKLTEHALGKFPNSNPYLNTRAVALYRMGDYNEALKALNKSVQQYQLSDPGPLQQQASQGSIADQLFMAMTLAKLNERDKARDLFNGASALIRDAVSDPAPTRPRATAWHRAEWELHQKEAAAAVKP